MTSELKQCLYLCPAKIPTLPGVSCPRPAGPQWPAPWASRSFLPEGSHLPEPRNRTPPLPRNSLPCRTMPSCPRRPWILGRLMNRPNRKARHRLPTPHPKRHLMPAKMRSHRWNPMRSHQPSRPNLKRHPNLPRRPSRRPQPSTRPPHCPTLSHSWRHPPLRLHPHWWHRRRRRPQTRKAPDQRPQPRPQWTFRLHPKNQANQPMLPTAGPQARTWARAWPWRRQLPPPTHP